MTAQLLAECVLPGCRNVVTEPGDTCADCIQAFGDRLRPTGRPPLTAEQIEERDSTVTAIYAARAMQRRYGVTT